jgi:hypothetical protein
VTPAEALLVLALVGVAAGVVLRDVAAYERPERPRRERAPKRERPERPERRERRHEPEPVAAGGPLVTAVAAAGLGAPGGAGYADPDDTWLGRIAATEQDERSAGRRVVSALLLLTLTLLAAGLVGAGIYRGLSGFAK